MNIKPANIASFLHFSFIVSLLCFLTKIFDYYILEMSIVVILLYEIGFKIDFVDDLIEMNSKVIKYVNKFCKSRFTSHKQKTRRKNND